jgi:hypothetical protein
LAWDAINGTPLRGAVYASGDSSPVLELRVTDISFSSVPDSVFAINPPPGAKVIRISSPSGQPADRQQRGPVTGLSAVGKQVDFPISSPSSLSGRSRDAVRLIEAGGKGNGALVTYGKGLDGIAVLEVPASGQGRTGLSGPSSDLKVPQVSINGVSGQELDTALGTVIQFKRAGVEYTVAGSAPPTAVQDAARGL